MTKIVAAYLFTNGMVAAFDENGEQVPEYQGIGTEMIPKLRKDYPELVIVGKDWATDVRPNND